MRSKFSSSSFIHCAAVKLSTREDLERRGYTEKEAFAPLLHVEVISGSLLMSDDCTDSTQLKKRQPPNLGNLLATATTLEVAQEDYNHPEFDKIINIFIRSHTCKLT